MAQLVQPGWWLPRVAQLALRGGGWEVLDSDFCANATYDQRLDDPRTFNFCS